MEYPILLLLHVVFGALWVGAAVLSGFFLVPSVLEAGPAGGQVMAGMMRRKFALAMTVFAIITVLAGIRLFMLRISMGGSAWLGTPEGIVLIVGSVLALGGFGIGAGMQGPTAMKIGALGAQIAKAGKPTPEQGVQMGALQQRLAKAARLQAYHLLAALVLMAGHTLAISLSHL